MASYELDGKYAIVTGGGSGINLAITKLLLEKGCSVMIADLRLRPEAEAVIDAYQHPPSIAGRPSVLFHETDVADWCQLTSLWTAALDAFGRVNIVVNGAGIYQPSSNFWHLPGVDPVAQDAADQTKGSYKAFSINTIGPIRLAQIAVDYWFEHRDVEGNLLWIASLAGYSPMLANPLYCASKAAIISMVKCLAPLKQIAGIRNAAVCPGVVRTPLLDQSNTQSILHTGDAALSSEQLASVAIQVLTEPQYGDGNVLEARMIKKRKDKAFSSSKDEEDEEDEDEGEETLFTREVPLELVGDPVAGDSSRMIKRWTASAQKVAGVIAEKGLRSGDDSF